MLTLYNNLGWNYKNGRQTELWCEMKTFDIVSRHLELRVQEGILPVLQQKCIKLRLQEGILPVLQQKCIKLQTFLRKEKKSFFRQRTIEICFKHE
jgi:hypothetical protein